MNCEDSKDSYERREAPEINKIFKKADIKKGIKLNTLIY